jgi:hypothetical protein
LEGTDSAPIRRHRFPLNMVSVQDSVPVTAPWQNADRTVQNSTGQPALVPQAPDAFIRAFGIERDITELERLIAQYLGATAAKHYRVVSEWETGEPQLVVDLEYSRNIPRATYRHMIEEYVGAVSEAAQRTITIMGFPR